MGDKRADMDSARAERDSDRADRDSDRADRDLSYTLLLRKWSTASVAALCLTLTVMWTCIVWNQQAIIGRQMEHERILKDRSARFERLEKSEAEQAAALKRLADELARQR